MIAVKMKRKKKKLQYFHVASKQTMIYICQNETNKQTDTRSKSEKYKHSNSTFCEFMLKNRINLHSKSKLLLLLLPTWLPIYAIMLYSK